MIGRWERWSYAAGDLGFNFAWQSTELYLLFYYVRTLGLSPATASSIFLAGALLDWVTDPLVGTLADRAAPRVPLRLWVIVGGPMSVLLLAAAFTPPPVPVAWVPLVALVTFLALRFAYALGNIPYAALTARMSPLPADHIALTGSRMQGAAIGGLVAAAIYALLPATAAGADFRDGALLLALLAVPAFLATFLGVRERVVPASADPVSAPANAWQTALAVVGLLRRSAELRRLLAAIVAAGLAVTVTNKSLLFLFEALGTPRLGFWIALAPSTALLLSAPIWARLAERFGRPRVLVIAAVLSVAALLLALGLGGVPAIAIGTCVAIVGGCGLSIMFWSLVPAAVADCELRMAESGCAGRIYALANMARKLAQALAPQVIAFTLTGSSGSTLMAMAATAAVALAVVTLYPPRGASPT